MGTRGGGGIEKRLVDDAQVKIDAYEAVYAGPLVGVNPLRALSSVFKIIVGIIQSLRIIVRHRPQTILLTGGWANVPLALAATVLRVPMLIYLPDIEPGSTIKVLSRFAKKVATTTEASSAYIPSDKMVVTGYPIRESVTKATRDEAITEFGLDPDKITILVTGGSRGARNINIAIEAILPELLAQNIQIIHVTGKLDWERSQDSTAQLTDKMGYYPYNYLESARMGLAFAASDIIIGRSGASVLGEFPYFGAASILIPYPYAWRYQRVNADWLVERGAGIRLDDDETLHDKLKSTLVKLVDNKAILHTMQASAKAQNKGNGADNIAAELLKLAGENT